MCIAILKTKDGKITDEELRNCFETNPDGAGIAYMKEGTLHYQKGIFKADDLIKAVREAEKVSEGAMLIHCRIGTSGLKDASNTHPFVINNSAVLIHNGILDVEVPKNSKINDTQIFIEKYLKDIPGQAITGNKSIQNMIEDLIGAGNKFVIMDTKGDYVIINESAGHWKDGVWFSNYGYQSYSSKWYGWGRNYGNEYDWDETYSYQGYGDSNTRIDQNTYFDILEAIDKLKTDDYVELGYYPAYDPWTGRLYNPDTDLTIKSITPKYLCDLSCELYDYYVDNMEEMYEFQDEKEEEVVDVKR